MYRLSFVIFALLVISTQSYPLTPPVNICGNTALLTGPSTPPPGAITVPAGINAGFNFKTHGATYWFAPGVHYLEYHQYAKVVPGNYTTFIGGPGAILDGNHTSNYAFGEDVPGVTIRYLEIRNFGNDTNGPTNNDEAVINQNSAYNWTFEYNYVHDNDGAGMFLGTNSVTRFNCLKNNGQYGFSAYRREGVFNITFESNEVAGNNQDDWENQHRKGCGCTGGGKFWDVRGAVVRNNYVHDNIGPGIWADNFNSEFLIENNYIENNNGNGIFYEMSFNYIIRDNTFKRNALYNGLNRKDNFPEGAIYISESGGEPLAGSKYSVSEISNNYFEDNWDGVVLWENADRFCRPFEKPDTTNGCPWFNNTWGFRYKTANIDIHNNIFKFDPVSVNCTKLENCGRNAIFSNYGTWPSNSTYKGNVIQQAVTFSQNNNFFNNTYIGTWKFMPYSTEHTMGYNYWRNPPYRQDNGSTINGADPTATPNTPSQTPTQQPGKAKNHLDAATSTLESGVGQWNEWYSASIASSSAVPSHNGSKSLQVSITGPDGWGVSLNNWPGFYAGEGPKKVSAWAKIQTGITKTPKITLSWFNSTSSKIGTDYLPFTSLTNTWTEYTLNVNAPNGTSYVNLALTGAETTGTVLYFDDFLVGDLELN